MRQVPKFFILGAILFAFCASTPGFAYDGFVTVGSVTAAPGEQAAVPVYLNNNTIEVASLTVPMKYSSADLEVDSISFVGTLLKPGMNPLVMIDNADQSIRFTYYPGATSITESEGLLATVFFSVNVSATDQTVAVDSVYEVEQYGEYQVWKRVEFADNSGLALFFPDFTGGTVAVKTPLDADYDLFSLPTQLELNQNFPNPFNPSTTIKFSLPERSHVTLTVFNILGQEIEKLVNETRGAGSYEVNWDASSMASGVYFYRLSYQDQVLTKKMALLK